MHRQLIVLILLALFSISATSGSDKSVSDFTLRNVDGKNVSLKDYPKAKGFIIVFTCNHCPFAKLYPPRLNELNTKYKQLGVPLLAISSTDIDVYESDSYPNMVAKAKAEKFNFPYLHDITQAVAKDFNAQKTPHAFVIWKDQDKWLVKYNGAIDDNGAEPDKVTQHYVVDAVDALLNGKEVKVKETKSIGCQIHFSVKPK
jgi:peroxiredoxin